MKFSDLGFKKFINDGLAELGFVKPTIIQQKVIPLIKKNKSVIAQSHTGTGKTHSFLLPILNNLDYQANKVQALIIAPTRELARQIFNNTKELLKFNPLATFGLFIGGDDIEKQSINLKNKQPMIVIGTPTRLKSLYEQNLLQITTSNYVVIDECDMIFDLGFIDDLDFMLAKINQQANISLFSATINNGLKPFLTKYLAKAQFIENINDNPTNSNIEHVLVWTKNKENKYVLKLIVESINPYVAMIFVNKKDQVKQVISWLNEFGIKNIGELHGDLDPRQRANMQKRIQNMEFKWIVASDVASRGIDIDGVSHIISIDLPRDLEYYIHRSGRTGRKQYSGQSYVLFNSNNQHLIDTLKSMKIEFKSKKLVGDKLVDIETKKKTKLTNKNSPVALEEQKIISKYKNKPIKPGYKKKRKLEIDKVKKDIRRKHIKESIAKIKKAKYKKRREELFDN
ncbi:ATP-dependent RNA helicase CshB [Spiroplasma gladiatoris]|uniref:ATP-dependent RNA helicase CshB n=1 Tax=Spiroplasma gladiatoris TaxID=2143 RepID=A0A4P7AHG2_9MOLU|nr:DEAD/DEAH box helicase [Spiroplasma gladiatoris]QBQ07627.1 ATP-dependent RNA helicase CshB [Spiroplasma gladiatoris]